MSGYARARRSRVAWILFPVLIAGCFGSPSPTDVPPPPARQDYTRAESRVTLTIDPLDGTINGQAPRQVLTEGALALEVEPAELSHADGQTRFRVIMRHMGGGVSDLSLVVEGDRALSEPVSPVLLGILPEGGAITQWLAFRNDPPGPFQITLRFSASLSPADTAPLPPPESPAAYEPGTPPPSPEPTPTPTPTPTPKPSSGGGGGGGGGGSATPTPSSTPTPTPEPTPDPTPTPTPDPTPTPTPSPTATATPLPGDVPNPGPNAIRGRVYMNGQPASGITSITQTWGRVEFSLKRVVNNGWVESIPISTDSQGYFTVTGLPEGDYLVYYYNEIHRDKVGFWKSRTHRTDATTGAVFPAVDLHMVGQENTPLPNTRQALPTTFQWQAPHQPVVWYRLRLHSEPGTSFQVVYQSNRLDGDQTTFTWDGTGAAAELSSTKRYFWGLAWDLGPVGEGGNLYQAIYFDTP